MTPKVKVTRIANRWHARLLINNKIFDEMACNTKCDIGWICREMLRWYQKLGGNSAFADAARKRQSGQPVGRIWWRKDLNENQSR